MSLFAKQTLTLRVAGMTCGNCVAHVTQALQDVAGVKKVHVDLESGDVRVTANTKTKPESLAAAVRSAGYTTE